MQGTQQNTCPIDHCAKPAPHTTICHSCVDEAERALNQFTSAERLRLEAIARGQENPSDTSIRNGNNGPTDVLDLPTWELAQNIRHNWPQLLPYLAARPDAQRLYWRIIAGCELAQAKINGPTQDWAPGDIQQANKQLAQPMRTTELIDWMWTTFRIKITHGQLRNWTHRGKITPATGQGMQHKTYRPKDILEAIQ